MTVWNRQPTLVSMLFAVSTADSDAVDNVALLGLVSEAAGFIGARRAGGAVDHVELTILPASRMSMSKSTQVWGSRE